MVSCEDDYIYVFNKHNGQEEARIQTFGSTLLSVDFIDNKVRTIERPFNRKQLIEDSPSI
jgi:hypothetical protein